jgi:hypothetical protein
MLLLQDATITEQNVRIDILESSGLAKPEELMVDTAVLHSVLLLCVINDSTTCFSYKVPYKNISTNRHTDTNETLRTERNEGDICIKGRQGGAVADDAVRYIERSLLRDAIGEDGSLGDVEVKSSILLEDVLELSQDLQRHAQLGLDVTIIGIHNRPGLRVFSKNTSTSGE